MFSEYAWNSCLQIFEQAKNLPFNVELKNGTLAPEKFKFYMEQDSLYLIDFARVLALAASKAKDPAHVIELIKLAEGAILCERNLHKDYLGLFDANLSGVKKSLACFAYTNFLLSVAGTGSLVEILAATLPCFWYYRELGVYIHKNSSKTNPYSKWIETYGSEDFRDITNKIIKLTNELSEGINLSSPLGKNMLDLFRTSSELEVLFWSDAYIQSGFNFIP